MSQRWVWLAVGIGLWMVCMGAVGPWLVNANWTERNVPPNLRADRWELSTEGMRARKVTEAECEPLPPEVWFDFPEVADEPTLEGGSEELTACFADKVAPRFARDRLD